MNSKIIVRPSATYVRLLLFVLWWS